MSNIICVIPARFASTRLPGKPLADVCGKPLIQWVYERAASSKRIQTVYVATDDKRIFDAVRAFGGLAIMTTGDYQSGADRIADAVKDMDWDVLVNLQGDEPMMHPDTIDRAIDILEKDPDCSVSTAMIRITNAEHYASPHVVKVVCAPDGRALYFSRSPIPSLSRAGAEPDFSGYFGFKHLGLYAYRRHVLLEFTKISPSFLEKLEKLEQLRFLENGYIVKVVETIHDSIGVDTPEDLENLKSILQSNKEKR
ncbi:3-deoxy-manno-octulosonate cytidylyltransferase [Candidatus Sumerlaeota bacterium]|nr:3-deoxy-manno-octulosonate cytidylyltransferase [Candidatus Sumerlaeota bacterium]